MWNYAACTSRCERHAQDSRGEHQPAPAAKLKLLPKAKLGEPRSAAKAVKWKLRLEVKAEATEKKPRAAAKTEKAPKAEKPAPKAKAKTEKAE